MLSAFELENLIVDEITNDLCTKVRNFSCKSGH